MRIVPLYTALLALIFVGLSIRTLRLRAKLRVAVGDAGNELMLRGIRAHSNFAEYVPLSLLLLFFVETGGASSYFVHSLGICLVTGRIVHAYGLSQVPEPRGFRVTGMALTFTSMIGAAASLLLLYIAAARLGA